MVANRRSIETAQLEVKTTYHTGRDVLSDGRSRAMFKSVRIAGDRQLQIVRGDQEGVVIRTTDGGVDSVAGRSPLLRLQTPSEFWERSDGSPIAKRHMRPRRAQRYLRTLGIASELSRGDVDDVVWDDNTTLPGGRNYEETREGNLEIVRIRSDSRTRTYWIDPEKGWSPIRVRDEYQDGSWTECRNKLDRVDGIWFPRASYMFSSRYESGTQPTLVIEIQAAEFNRAEHAHTLTMADMGIDAGFVVFDYATSPATSARWNGEAVVSSDEFARQLKSGEVAEGPSFRRSIDRLSRDGEVQSPLADAPQDGRPIQSARISLRDAGACETLWEEYVRQFVQKYDLVDGQAERAKAIVRDSRQRACAYLRSRKDALNDLAIKFRRLEEKEGTPDPEERRRLKERETKILAPVRKIFEESVKPRLDKIPTRSQRAAAEADRNR